MTQYLGIITAYAAVAVLAWLAALLRPELLPSASSKMLQNRWREAAVLALATLAMFTIGWAQASGWLLSDDSVIAASLARILVFCPLLAYLAWQGTVAAALVPSGGVVRSLGLGLALAAIALAAYCSARDSWDDLPAIFNALASADTIAPAIGLILQDLAIAALLALLADGWSRRTALAITLAVFAAIHLPLVLGDNLTAQNVGAMLANAALVAGIASAVLHTRNVLWFLPAHALLALATLEPM